MQKGVITTCIIPAAGKGSRWAPVSGYLPKEMLPLIDRPVLDWVIDEAVDSGCTQIVIVINKQKKIIADYLSKKYAKSKVKLVFVNQEHPLGIAHALLLCKRYINDEPFAMALPDLPTISRKPVLQQLINAYKLVDRKTHIISFSHFPTDNLHHYTECLLEQRKDKLLRVVHFCPKSPDNRSHHPGNKVRMSGRYILNPEILSIVDNLMKIFSSGEIKEFDALKKATESGQDVLGVDIEGHTYDTGNPLSYVRANTAFFKKKLSRKI